MVNFYDLNSLTADGLSQLQKMGIVDSNQNGRIDPEEANGQDCSSVFDQYSKLQPKTSFAKTTEDSLDFSLKTPDPEKVSDGMPGHFEQGRVGDCWFLAPVDNQAECREGLLQLKEMTKNNHDGTYTTVFPGAKDKTPILVTDGEIERGTIQVGLEHKAMSSGDIDVKIWEIAADKYIVMHPKEFDGSEGIEANYIDVGIKLVTGKKSISYDATNPFGREKIEYILNTVNPSRLLCATNDKFVTTEKDEKGEKKVGLTNKKELSQGRELFAPHSYNIRNVDRKNKMVYLANSHDNSPVMALSYDEFCAPENNFFLTVMEKR